MLQEIVNYLSIHSNLGTSGQPTAGQFAAIKDAGYEMIINLVPASSPEALVDEEAIVKGLGMDYLHIPVIWDAPTRRDLECFFAALNQNQERKVLVHCVLNFRVSAFVFLYRVLIQGIKMEKARQLMLVIWEPNPTWQRFIQEQLQPESGFAVPHRPTSQETDATTKRRPDL